ncbi:MAG: FAD:protein FMN transferase [Bryobacterales bacterium]|nr:FAD:protein FMN transferase [Bryobacterales bacterium]
MMARLILMLLVVMLSVSAAVVRVEKSIQAMGTTYTIAAYGEDAVNLEAILDMAFEEVRRVDELLSNYKPGSELSQLNQTAAKGPQRVTPEMFTLLQRCQQYSQRSEGTFDITVGPLMKIWGFYKGKGKIPTRREITESLDKIGIQNIVLNPDQQTVSFLKRGVELDAGGVGKGYAVDRLVEKMRAYNVRAALVSASTSSIYAMGAPPGEPRGWKVSIKDPRQPDRTIETVYLKDQSMSTSGSYEKFFQVDGVTYSHIMDPRTGMPARGTASVSIIAPSTLDSEVWAKPYFIQGKQWAATHKPKEFKVFFCEDKADHPCAWLP